MSLGTEALDLGRDSNGRRVGCLFVLPTPLILRTETLGLGLDSNERRKGCSQVLPMPHMCRERLRFDRCLPRYGIRFQHAGIAAAEFFREGVRRL